jgi:hypothetical protein
MKTWTKTVKMMNKKKVMKVHNLFDVNLSDVTTFSFVTVLTFVIGCECIGHFIYLNFIVHLSYVPTELNLVIPIFVY